MNTLKRNLGTVVGIVAAAAIITITTLTVLADAPQPALTIVRLGSNQFLINITNGVATTNYTLFWAPALNDDNYPWQVLGVTDAGETNFMVDGGDWPLGFFQVLLGADRDADGVQEWLDAQPLNPSVGVLGITIDSPLNGTSLN